MLLAGVALLLAISMVVAMTAAWYTNVVQSGGLIFNVTEWDMEGGVILPDLLTNAAPGEHGVIPVEVRNDNEGLIDVQLNVSKVSLYNDLADMRKRLYFYIDDTVTRADETVQRVYVNSAETYRYTVAAKQTLQLGEGGNGAPLRWEWVFDVLGYYFHGKVTESGATVDEYLRPVEYDVEAATFENGNLKTVDGTTTAAAFIEELTAHDGFDGTVTTHVTTADGRVYYPVSVDEAGKGVWIYCCTLNEIEYESVVDTNVARAAEQEKRQFRTTLNVVAEQKKLTVATVVNEQELRDALADDTHNMIVLAGNVTLDTTVSVTNQKEKIVDLAGSTLSVPFAGHVFNLTDGASLTVMDGEVVGNASHTGALVNATGSDVALSGLTVTDVKDVVRIADETSQDNDSFVTITDCDLSCSSMAVFVKGNGVLSEAPTRVIIENSRLVSSGYYAIAGSGNAFPTGGNYGTDIVVRDSTVEGYYSAIYHPQRESSLLVENSTLAGITPLVMKGGDAVLVDAVVTASNQEGVQQLITPPAANKSGYSDTGAGVYVEGGFETPASVQMRGNTQVTAHYADALLVFDPDATGHTITVTGGSYSHDVTAYLADGYTCTPDGNGRYTVQKEQTP